MISQFESDDTLSLNAFEAQNRQAVNDRYTSDTRDRKWLSRWVAIVVSLWLLLVYFLLLRNDARVHLSDSVLIAVVTTTTINILGLPLAVLLNMFPKKEK